MTEDDARAGLLSGANVQCSVRVHRIAVISIPYLCHRRYETMPSNAFLKAESAARNAEASVLTSSASDKLEATITAAELYFKALRLVESPVERKKIDSKCKSLLDQAESLRSLHETGVPTSAPSSGGQDDLPFPASTRWLATREKIIISKAQS